MKILYFDQSETDILSQDVAFVSTDEMQLNGRTESEY